MSILFGFLQVTNLSLSKPVDPLPSTADQMPHLIALESTSIPRVIPPTLVAPAIRTEASLLSAQAITSPIPTPLQFVVEQPSEIIGYSVEGRPLEVYIFGNGERERMIVAGIHGGDEWNTVTLANQLIKALNQHPNLIPEDVTLYILPNLNLDGEARAHNKYGRLNHTGVDLNRNFPVNGKADWGRSGCWNALPTSG